MRNYVLLRTAAVISGEGLELKEFRNNSFSADGTPQEVSAKVYFKPGVKKIAMGSAAAVDRRGYLVTAAHCIEEGGIEVDVFLMFSRSKALQVLKKARIVWSGRDPSGNGLDFAVLKIASPLNYVFEWGPMPENDESVLGVGVSNEADSTALSIMAAFGGRVLTTYERQKSGVKSAIICHDCPLREGNSGGPLINREGQLLGANFAVYRSVESFVMGYKHGSYAARPDAEWLAELIEQDYAALTGKMGRNP